MTTYTSSNLMHPADILKIKHRDEIVALKARHEGELSYLTEQCEMKNGRIVEIDRQLQDAQRIINQMEGEAHGLRDEIAALRAVVTAVQHGDPQAIADAVGHVSR